MISVVIPLYNKAKSIETTIKSVLEQTYQDFEIIVVNDGSTDGGEKIVAAINNPRIRLINQPNAGVSAARNHGIAEAKGEFIALLDGDDFWKPEYLATQIALTEKYPECSVFATNYEFLETTGKIKPTIINRLPFTDTDGILSNYFEVATCSHPPLWTSAVMARKEAIISVGGFPEGITSGEDLITWAKLACKFNIAFTKSSQAIYVLEERAHGKAPIDLQSTKDAVGLILKQLYNQQPSLAIKHGLKKYISYWYKMRTSINLSLGYKLGAWRCAIESLKFQCQPKVLIMLTLILLPTNLTKKIIRTLRK